MKNSLKSFVRTLGITLTIGTAAFGVVRAGELAGNYSCCGTGSTPLAERCRYTDRAIACETDNVCANDGDYRLCCTNACYKSDEGPQQ